MCVSPQQPLYAAANHIVCGYIITSLISQNPRVICINCQGVVKNVHMWLLCLCLINCVLNGLPFAARHLIAGQDNKYEVVRYIYKSQQQNRLITAGGGSDASAGSVCSPFM